MWRTKYSLFQDKWVLFSHLHITLINTQFFCASWEQWWAFFPSVCMYGIDFKEHPVCRQQGACPRILWSWYTWVVHTGGWEIAGLKAPKSFVCFIFWHSSGCLSLFLSVLNIWHQEAWPWAVLSMLEMGLFPRYLLLTTLPRKRFSSLLSPAQSLTKAAWYWLLLMPVDCSNRRQGQLQVGPGVPLILQLPLWTCTLTLPRIPVINGRAVSAGSQGASGSRQETPSLNLIDAWFRKLEPGFA